jgi:hypothetical protein
VGGAAAPVVANAIRRLAAGGDEMRFISEATADSGPTSSTMESRPTLTENEE